MDKPATPPEMAAADSGVNGSFIARAMDGTCAYSAYDAGAASFFRALDCTFLTSNAVA